MKSSAVVLLIASVPIALLQLAYDKGAGAIILLLVFGIVAILDFVFMLENKANKKLLWIHIIPLLTFVGMFLYLALFDYGMFVLSFIPIIAAYILSFCALLVHIDNSIKQKQIKDMEAEISRLKG